LNIILYYILISFIPFLANISGFIVSRWSCEELDSLHKYIDLSTRIILILMLGAVLSQFQFIGFLVLIGFIVFILSKKFWIHETITLLIIAILNVITHSAFILILTFTFILLMTALDYYKVHNTKKIRAIHYGLHAIRFLKRFWKYYMFLLFIEILFLILIII